MANNESETKLRELAKAALDALKGKLEWSSEEYKLIWDILAEEGKSGLPTPEQFKGKDGTIKLESIVEKLPKEAVGIAKSYIQTVHDALYNHLILGFETIDDSAISPENNENSRVWIENIITKHLANMYFGEEIKTIKEGHTDKCLSAFDETARKYFGDKLYHAQTKIPNLSKPEVGKFYREEVIAKLRKLPDSYFPQVQKPTVVVDTLSTLESGETGRGPVPTEGREPAAVQSAEESDAQYTKPTTETQPKKGHAGMIVTLGLIGAAAVAAVAGWLYREDIGNLIDEYKDNSAIHGPSEPGGKQPGERNIDDFLPADTKRDTKTEQAAPKTPGTPAGGGDSGAEWYQKLISGNHPEVSQFWNGPVRTGFSSNEDGYIQVKGNLENAAMQIYERLATMLKWNEKQKKDGVSHFIKLFIEQYKADYGDIQDGEDISLPFVELAAQAPKPIEQPKEIPTDLVDWAKEYNKFITVIFDQEGYFKGKGNLENLANQAYETAAQKQGWSAQKTEKNRQGFRNLFNEKYSADYGDLQQDEEIQVPFIEHN